MRTTAKDEAMLERIANTPFEDTQGWKRIVYQLRLTRPERKRFARDLRQLLAEKTQTKGAR